MSKKMLQRSVVLKGTAELSHVFKLSLPISFGPGEFALLSTFISASVKCSTAVK